MNKKELIDFEKEIESLYAQRKIKAPIHLSENNEERLIEIFKKVDKNDWVFSNYRNHYHALLKGIQPDWLREEIIKGNSMHIMNKEYRFYTSSIVGGQLPIALGVAMAIKRKNLENKVWAFCGDMAAETGVFYEVMKYALRNDLPINFVIEDNSWSVYTPTQEVWGNASKIALRDVGTGDLDMPNSPKIIKYKYERTKSNHGIGLWVDFGCEKRKDESYQKEIKRAMEILSKDERILFIGQTVDFKGSPIYGTLEEISKDKRIEMPVMEEVQMGISTGLALEGYIPVSIYPRFDFLILATNQLVNHLDKTKELSHDEFNPKVIIRTMVGDKEPLYPGPQHCQDHTEAYKKMLTNTNVIKLENSSEIVNSYIKALKDDKSSLIIEMAGLYK